MLCGGVIPMKCITYIRKVLCQRIDSFLFEFHGNPNMNNVCFAVCNNDLSSRLK